MSTISVFVNEDVRGDAVAIMLEGAELIEVEGELQPMLELSPARAFQVAEALVKCAGEIINEARR